MVENIVRCGNCDLILEDDTGKDSRIPCPRCGSTKRNVLVTVSESWVGHEGFGIKIKRPGLKRPIKEEVDREEFSRSRKFWVRRQMIIDRDEDWYYEKVSDIETGEVFHECDEPLSNHIGHGYAKTNN